MRLIYEDKLRGEKTVILRRDANPHKSSRILIGVVILCIFFNIPRQNPVSTRSPPAVRYKYHGRIGNLRVQRQ